MSIEPHSRADPAPVLAPMPPGAEGWQLTRNCAIAPSTFFWNIAALGLAPFLAGVGFWVSGYPLVMLFCVCQLLALGAAALVHAWHATDGEWVQVGHGKVHVEARCGGHRRVLDIHACWARLERGPCDSLVLRSGRDALSLGDQLTPARRRMFAEEFAASLARAKLQDARIPARDGDIPGCAPLRASMRVRHRRR